MSLQSHPSRARLVTVVGARPQFIKAAPVSRAIKADGRLEELLVHTGQHYDDDMSGVFFRELDIAPPHRHLGVGGGSHGAMTGRMLEALEAVLVEEKATAVLVYGDTNSTLAGALAAAKLGLPIAHVEAGLRSFRRTQPEEINRIIADRLSTLLFCPTTTAVTHLAREGISRGVHLVGDVMYDAALLAVQAAAGSDITTRLGLEPKTYKVATLHRAENTDSAETLAKALDYLKAEAARTPVVLPLHPRTRAASERFALSFEGLTVTRPLSYFELAHLVRDSAGVLTDSGGLQKEAYFHRVPCVTLRDETEWTETVEAGWNRLWTTPGYAPRREITDYGDGHASERIASLLGDVLATRMATV